MEQPVSFVATPVIRVLLVDDSALALELIRRMLAGAPDIEVVGSACDGLQALELISALKPDVVCTDLHMPRMDGLALTHEIMARSPLPILILSISVQREQEHNIFQMLKAGALDVLAKPMGGTGIDTIRSELVTKIRVLAGVKVLGRRQNGNHNGTAATATTMSPLVMASPPRIIGIGASTGGPQAFDRILRSLPPDFPLPLLCVQHIAQGFMQGMVDWLAGCCRIRVCAADEGVAPQPGTAYFARDDRHLEVDAHGNLSYSSAPNSSGHRPSIDAAFSSIARVYGSAAIGVLLTGMGRDGAQGLLDIRQGGGLTIAQDEATSVVFGMPRRAIEIGAADHVLSLDSIGPALCDLASKRGNHHEP